MLVYLYCNSTAKLFSSIVIARCLTKPTRRVYEGLPKDFTHILCPDVKISDLYGWKCFYKRLKQNELVVFNPPRSHGEHRALLLRLFSDESTKVADAPLRARRKTHPIPPYREGTELLCSSTYQR